MPTLKDGGTNVKVQKIFILKNNMKNIHLLPTDKPSRLCYLTKKGKEVYKDLRLFDKHMPIILDSENQNIYITSDEEIKDGDWFYNTISLKPEAFKACENGDGYVNCSKYSHYRIDCKKIILTTDDQLIADGIQAIDDEFLEWFVKNPSCEEVEVEEESHIEIEEVSYEGDFQNVEYISYKIIIPQEEPKQDLEKEMFELEQELDIPSSMRWHNSKPKQEPLEEVAEKVLANNIDGLRDALQDDDLFLFYKGVIQCYGEAMANYQAKRMYSEEEVIKIVEKSRETGLTAEYLLLTKQFKKK
jgi:hypothetical protein